MTKWINFDRSIDGGFFKWCLGLFVSRDDFCSQLITPDHSTVFFPTHSYFSVYFLTLTSLKNDSLMKTHTCNRSQHKFLVSFSIFSNKIKFSDNFLRHSQLHPTAFFPHISYTTLSAGGCLLPVSKDIQVKEVQWQVCARAKKPVNKPSLDPFCTQKVLNKWHSFEFIGQGLQPGGKLSAGPGQHSGNTASICYHGLLISAC